MATTLSLGNFPVIPSAVKTPTTQNYVGGLGIHQPDIYNKLISRYGIQTIQSMVGAMGNFIPVTQQEFTHYEDDFIFSSFEAQVAVVPTSGVAATTFTIAAAYLSTSTAFTPDTNTGKAFVRVGDIVMVEENAQRALVTSTPTDSTFIVEPYGAAWSFTSGNNATDLRFIVVGRESIGISTTPSDTLTARTYKYDNTVMKIEDAARVEGGEMTNKLWFQVEANGKTGWTWGLKSQGDTHMRFESYCELQMIVGQQAANQAGALTGYKGTEGLETAVKSRGQLMDLAGGTIALADIDNMIKSLDKYKGSKYNGLYLGIDLRADIDDLVGSINARSSGAKHFGDFQDAMKSKGINMEFDYFERLGYKTMLHTYDVFNHPELLGATGFNYSGSGVLIPMGNGKEPKTGDSKAYLSVRYKALDGYSRLIEHWITGGANGIYTNDSDENKFNYRSERGFELFCSNKFFWIEK